MEHNETETLVSYELLKLNSACIQSTTADKSNDSVTLEHYYSIELS